MKIMAMVVMLSAYAVASCPKNCVEWEGNCACDVPAFKAEPVDVASDEKPRKEEVREWESGAVKADMPQSLIFSDAKQDAEKVQATAEGKKVAGILE